MCSKRLDTASFPKRSYEASISLGHYHNCARSRKEAVEAARVLNNLTKKCKMHKEIMTENEDQNTSNRKGDAFLLMLLQIIDSGVYDTIVKWESHGQSFKVMNPTIFLEQVLVIHLKEDNFDSFERKLGNYGFIKRQRRDLTGEVTEYRHKKFQRNDIELCRKIVKICHTAQTSGKRELSIATSRIHSFSSINDDHSSPRKRSKNFSSSTHDQSAVLCPHFDIEGLKRRWSTSGRLHSSRLIEENLHKKDLTFYPLSRCSYRQDSIVETYTNSQRLKKQKEEYQCIKQRKQKLLKHFNSNSPIHDTYYECNYNKERRKIHSIIIQNARRDLIRQQTSLISKTEDLIMNIYLASETNRG